MTNASKGNPKRVLVVENDMLEQVQFYSMFRLLCTRHETPIIVDIVDSYTEARDTLEKLMLNGGKYDMVLLDSTLQNPDEGLAVRNLFMILYPQTKMVVTSGEAYEEFRKQRKDKDFGLPIHYISKMSAPGMYIERLSEHLFGEVKGGTVQKNAPKREKLEAKRPKRQRKVALSYKFVGRA
jgi:hypothetical protein